MPFKDRWNRMVRKSISSSSSAGTADSSTAAKPTPATPNAASGDVNPLSPQVTTTSDTGTPLSKAPTSRLAKTLTWRSTKEKSTSSPTADAKKTRPRKPGKPLHPSERPLTETNMRHQELLGAFSMSFGRQRRPSQGGGRTSFASNVSPMGSRQPSVDGAANGPHAAHHLHGHSHLTQDNRRVSSMAREGIPADVEEEGSQASS